MVTASTDAHRPRAFLLVSSEEGKGAGECFHQRAGCGIRSQSPLVSMSFVGFILLGSEFARRLSLWSSGYGGDIMHLGLESIFCSWMGLRRRTDAIQRRSDTLGALKGIKETRVLGRL